MRGAEGGALFEAHATEFADHVFVLGIIRFVDAEHNGFALLAKDVGHCIVNGMAAVESIDHEEDEVGRLDGDEGFDFHLLGKAIADRGADAAGVDDLNGEAGLLDRRGKAVAGDAGHVVDNGDAVAGEPVEERALADVGSADDGDDALSFLWRILHEGYRKLVGRRR